jgi:hypothetical protein
LQISPLSDTASLTDSVHSQILKWQQLKYQLSTATNICLICSRVLLQALRRISRYAVVLDAMAAADATVRNQLYLLLAASCACRTPSWKASSLVTAWLTCCTESLMDSSSL